MTLTAVLLASNEPDWVRQLQFGDIPVTIAPLTTGDAWLATDDFTIVVERKTIPDLLASIADQRLLNQCAEMCKVSPWCYLVLTGHTKLANDKYIVAGKVSNWTVRRIEGALATVQQLGVTVVRNVAASPNDYKATLEWLSDRDHGAVRLEPRRQAIMPSPGERILGSLPGISQVRAQALLNHCATAAWALCYLTQDGGGNVPGVGPATKQAARQALGLDNTQELHIYTKEKIFK